jgi:hypothetical protein
MTMSLPSLATLRGPLDRRTLWCAAIAAGVGIGFYLYGVGRTMRGTIGFEPRTSLASLLLSGFLSLPVALPTLLFARLFWLRDRMLSVPLCVSIWAACLLTGACASEARILVDETRFEREVARSSGNSIYSRPRAWPHELCSLVFIPGKGIHGTD